MPYFGGHQAVKEYAWLVTCTIPEPSPSKPYLYWQKYDLFFINEQLFFSLCFCIFALITSKFFQNPC